MQVGLHAIAVDEHRRPFSPTFWTQPKASPPRAVEQTWFVGSHGNVGGGDPDRRLANLALVWMAGRLQALTGLAFDDAAMAAIGAGASRLGEIVDSTIGWPIDHRWPRLRTMLSPDAFDVGFLYDTDNPARENVNERVHWSVLERAAAPGEARALRARQPAGGRVGRPRRANDARGSALARHRRLMKRPDGGARRPALKETASPPWRRSSSP